MSKIGEWITPNIHVLYGTGDNCTCSDCVVLYGGECHTTPINNLLDEMELKLNEFLTKTPTGRERVVSNNYIDQAIERIISPLLRKHKKQLTKAKFDQFYYAFLPLIFLMTSDKKKANRLYRKARIMLFLDIMDNFDDPKHLTNNN